MRLAAIDIGTNSTKMTLADVGADGTLSVVAEDSEVTRLGEGVDAAKRLKDEAVARTLDAVQRFADAARAQGATQVLAAGTSALRDASNGPEFIAQALERSGVNVEVITGDREAQLAYSAVHSDASLHLSDDLPLLVFDVGGGSTELILGRGAEVQRYKSLDAGAVRLTERFLKSDPPTEEALAQASAFADELLATFPAPELSPRIVGIGGTAVNLAAVTQRLSEPDPDAVHAVVLSRSAVLSALARFRAVSLDNRREIPGLEPKRADVIIGGTLLLSRLLSYFHADQFTVSARGLRYGLLAEAAGVT